MNPNDLTNSDDELPSGPLISDHQPRALASLTSAARNVNGGMNRGAGGGSSGNSFDRNRYIALMELNNMLGDENAQAGFASPDEDVVPSVIIEVRDAVANGSANDDSSARSNTLTFSDENPDPPYPRYRTMQNRRHFQRQYAPVHPSISADPGPSASGTQPSGGTFLLTEEFARFNQDTGVVDDDRVEFTRNLLASVCLPELEKKE